MQIAIELDQADVNALDRRLKWMREEAPRALRNSINRTATAAKKPLTALINTGNGSKGFGSKGFQNQVGGYYGPFVRKGSSRLPIEKLYSLSVPSMVGNQGQVYGPTEPMIMAKLQTEVNAAVDKILGG